KTLRGWGPGVSVDVWKVAVPVGPRTATPKRVLPSRNCTGPVGTPAPGVADWTVAVSVTVWPNSDGLADEASRATLLLASSTRSSNCSTWRRPAARGRAAADG